MQIAAHDPHRLSRQLTPDDPGCGYIGPSPASGGWCFPRTAPTRVSRVRSFAAVGNDPAITRFAEGRLAKAQFRLSDGQKPASAAWWGSSRLMRVLLRVQLFGSGIGRAPAVAVQAGQVDASQYVLGPNAADRLYRRLNDIHHAVRLHNRAADR